MHEISDEFARCWDAARRHIELRSQGPLHSWLKVTLAPPFLEHLSFRLGNQLFFIRIEDSDAQLTVPGSRDGLAAVADGCNGHACIMPMQLRGAAWIPVAPGWGLLDAKSGQSINPIELVSDQKIEMTDWELHDFAVQVVRQHLRKADKKLMSWTGYPKIDPSIWFVGERGPEWIVVRAVRYPALEASPPADWRQIVEHCAHLNSISSIGHFAPISVANADDPFDPGDPKSALPLWRGHAMFVRFTGLVSVVS